MLKSDLIEDLARTSGDLTPEDARRVLETVLETMAATLEQGGRVELRDFGIFFVKQRKARMGRNPNTGVAVPVSAKTVLAFRCGKKLHERLNNAGREES